MIIISGVESCRSLKSAIEDLRHGTRQYESDLVSVQEATQFARDRAMSYFRDGYPVPDEADLYWKGIYCIGSFFSNQFRNWLTNTIDFR